MNVVIGAASGMGAAVVAKLVDRGALLLADRDADRLASVAAGLGKGVVTMACDLTAPADVDALAAAVDRLDALVVTAGLSPSMASGRPIYEVNLRGLERVVRAFEPKLGAGSVAVLFSSMAGHLLPPSDAIDAALDDPLSERFFDDLGRAGIDVENSALAYAVSKRGVLRLVRRHAARWGAKSARIVSVSPGIIDTPMGRLEAEHQPAMAGMVASSALRREGRADEVAAVAAFLASDAASFLTGADVLVDGGATAMLRR